MARGSGTRAATRARDLAQWAIGVWLAKLLGNIQLRLVDLGALVNKVPEEQVVVRSVAATIARLHARGKPNEQVRYGSRALLEADAEYVVSASGVLLREIGWAA